MGTANNGATFSPALLARARKLAAEYNQLSNDKTSETFNAKIAKRIGELQDVATVLKKWEDTKEAILGLQELLEDSSTHWEIREMADEDHLAATAQLEKLSRELTTSLTPKHPFAQLPCLIEIRPGAGGGEAAIFAADLLRMYRAYCIRKRFRSTIIKYETTDGEGAGSDAPISEVVLEIETPGSYDSLRGEAGVHRVQRVPATEKQGRTHTSAVSVMVLPSFPTTGQEGQEYWEADLNDPNSDYYVNPADVRTDVMRARGAGGQHVNTTDSAVRLTHVPTNTVVSMQEGRSQLQNRQKAWQVLRSRLAAAKREAREEQLVNLRRSVIGVAKMGRGDKIRTYNWGQQRVTDHRSGLSVYNLDDVMEGGHELDKVIDSVKAWFSDQEILESLTDKEAANHTKYLNGEDRF
ncbi:Peptide chain release factor 1, mitochondrial [Ciborinia camelliae]|nr:Peptide chain release factor 1, mitochondrial [Ciborinia camelliae]